MGRRNAIMASSQSLEMFQAESKWEMSGNATSFPEYYTRENTMTVQVVGQRTSWVVVLLLVVTARVDGAAPRQMRDDPFPQEVCLQWTVQDGLPADLVQRVWVDRSGKVLAATPKGSAVLDGDRWVRADVSPDESRSAVAMDELPSPLPWEPVPWEPVTVAQRDRQGRLWIGTAGGAARWTGDRWRCYHSRRWLPNDHVTSLAFGADGAVWVGTKGGVARLATEQMTLEEKARRIHDGLRKRHVWRGLVRSSALENPGKIEPYRLPSNDNDGLWTALYVAAESFRYAATGDENAKRNATESMDALLFLEEVTGLPGFIARSYMPAGQGSQYGGTWYRSADGKWDWKADTSSDELDGHNMAWAIYYDLVADEAYRRRIAGTVDRVMARLIKDGYYWIGPDGKPTRWGVWAPERLNLDPTWLAERGLNSLEILSFLKVAYHVTGKEKFQQAYEALIRDHAYATNTIRQKFVFPPSIVNHSDDELAFVAYYPILRLASDPDLRKIYLLSVERSWQIERPERAALFNFIYASAFESGFQSTEDTIALVQDLLPSDSEGAGGFDLPETVAELQDVPLDMISWTVVNSTRKDVPWATHKNRFGRDVSVEALPVSERPLKRWNGDPFELDAGDGGTQEDDGTFFLLPYWMGRYYKFILPPEA
jgi:two component regulator with propeller domain